MKYLKYLILVFVLVCGFVAFRMYAFIFGPSVKENTELFIFNDSTYEELIQILADKQLINRTTIFLALAEKMNLPNHVHGGRYIIEQGTSTYDLIVQLRGGMQTPVKMLINNVNFKTDLAANIASQLALDSAAVMSVLGDTSTTEQLGFTEDEILCLFIPNTYELYWNIGLDGLLEKFVGFYDEFWSTSRKEQANALGLTPKEVFILASIVEKEYKYADERSRIAGVYLNRLEKGMKLQADPTVKFALGDLSIKRVLTVHTEYDHPYNTYYYADLPPGPICLPETSTIDAVLHAEKHSYLYFCAKEDLSGYHTFSTNYNDHLKAARLYQAALNKLHIYE